MNLKHSIYSNKGKLVLENDVGKFVAENDDNSIEERESNLENYKKIQEYITEEIINYSKNPIYSDEEYEKKIINALSKIEKNEFKVKVNTLGISVNNNVGSTQIVPNGIYKIKKGTILYRFTDDAKKHVYTNPKQEKYGRFTVPGKKSTFYLSFDKNTAEYEVKGSNSTSLITYKVIKDFKAKIIPGYMPIVKREDCEVANVLKKFHNFIFKLSSTNACFNEIDSDNERLKKGIYIVTNELLSIIGNDVEAIIYPSVKVKENEFLGKSDNNDYFIPNKKNANLAIFNDINYDQFRNQYSNYVVKVD